MPGWRPTLTDEQKPAAGQRRARPARTFGRLPFLPILALLAWLCACAPPAATPETTAAFTSPPATAASLPSPTPLPPTPSPPPSPSPSPSPTAQISRPAQETPIYGYRVINVFPHDRKAFTQGLVWEDGLLYEGTGLVGQSSLRKVDLETGAVLQIHPIDPNYFGEGIAIYGDQIFQLTWQDQIAFLYDKKTFEQLDTFTYPTEGWGLTFDGSHLIMSDGTATLYFRDPGTFAVVDQVQVHDENGPVIRLNELEYIQGQVYANVWQTDRVAIIDPATGQVTAWLNLAGLLEPEDFIQPVDVLNSIAYDAANDRIFVTGKWWPKLFEIELVLPERTYLPLVLRG
jgi:glutamine cyclotransferase